MYPLCSHNCWPPSYESSSPGLSKVLKLANNVFWTFLQNVDVASWVLLRDQNTWKWGTVKHQSLCYISRKSHFSLGNSSIARHLCMELHSFSTSPLSLLFYYDFDFSLREAESKYYKSTLAFPKVTFRTLVPWGKSWDKDSEGKEFWESAVYFNIIFQHPGAISRSKDLKSHIRKKAIQFYLIQHFPDLFDHGFFFFSSNICALRNSVLRVSGEKWDYLA
jgi:hypothetical protein